MDKNLKKELYKYIKPSSVSAVIFVCISIIFFLMAYASVPKAEDDSLIQFLIFLIFGIIFLIYFVSHFCTLSSIKKKIKTFEHQGEFDLLANDFLAGGKAFNDNLRLGQKFLIGKKTGTIVSYQDIVKIYQYAHKTNGVEDSRMLKIETTNKKNVNLCKIPLKGKADNEVAQVCDYIARMTSRVFVGYGN